MASALAGDGVQKTLITPRKQRHTIHNTDGCLIKKLARQMWGSLMGG